MDKKLGVVFLWHMHQPLYKDLLSGKYYLPWVRLHSTFSYLDMVSVLDDFPGIRCTFNLTPSLMWQLMDISASDDLDDIFLKLSAKDAAHLDEKEKVFILKNFFSCSLPTAIFPIRDYMGLYSKRGDDLSDSALKKRAKTFSVQEMRDLQVFFNIAWCGFTLKEKDPLVKELYERGGGYSEEEKRALLKRQHEVVKSILPLYRKMQDEGRIEVSTTPFYHPILPLLLDGSVKEGFDFKKDAVWHVEEAVRFYEKVFGRKPVGMWPAEGGVSKEIIPVMASAGIKWIATDESILHKSMQGQEYSRDDFVFSICDAAHGGKNIAIAFRDTNISNDIGFRYSGMPSEQSASDLFKNIMGIRAAVVNRKGSHVVSIILDGENPWPYYADGGKGFLSETFRLLNSSHGVETLTFADCADTRDRKKLKDLDSGSWIYGNFGKWIGSHQKTRAWKILEKTRKDLFSMGKPSKEALEELYIAEGSDWFWWYDDFGTELNFIFDDIFRLHLKNIYKLMGKEPPSYLDVPICDTATGHCGDAAGLMPPPVIDGRITDELEWGMARVAKTREISGEMVRTDSRLAEIAYGMDRENVYIMVRPAVDLMKGTGGKTVLAVDFASPGKVFIEIPFVEKGEGIFLKENGSGRRSNGTGIDTFAFKEVMELAIPLPRLGAKEASEINFTIALKKDGVALETWPAGNFFRLVVPE